MAKIPYFQKARLRFGAHFAVMSAFDEKVAELANSEAQLTSAYNSFKSALTNEDAAVKIARASEYSSLIMVEDTKRDRLYSNGKITAEMWEELGIEPQATAARAVMREVRLYKVDIRAQYDQETGLMMNFLQPFESAAMQEHLATLGLTAVFTQMKAANEEVRRLLALRGDERAANSSYDLKAARQATDAAYDVIVERINALAVLDDEHRFDTFIAQWSAEIARIKQQILSQSTQTNNDEGGTTPDPSEGGENGGEQGGETPPAGGDTGGDNGGTTPDNPENPGGDDNGGGGTPPGGGGGVDQN